MTCSSPPRFAKELPALRSAAAVERFARRVEVHPGIVVGRLQHDGFVKPSHLNWLKVYYQWGDAAGGEE